MQFELTWLASVTQTTKIHIGRAIANSTKASATTTRSVIRKALLCRIADWRSGTVTGKAPLLISESVVSSLPPYTRSWTLKRGFKSFQGKSRHLMRASNVVFPVVYRWVTVHTNVKYSTQIVEYLPVSIQLSGFTIPFPILLTVQSLDRTIRNIIVLNILLVLLKRFG